MVEAKRNKLYFQGQKISPLKDTDAREYELLMRQDVDGVPCFPYSDFLEIMTNHDRHKAYMEDVYLFLKDVLTKNPTDIFSFNLEYQELFYEETFDVLNRFDDSERARLKMELTERLPLQRCNFYDEFLPKEQIAKLSKLGYAIVLDDFLIGMNALAGLFDVQEYVSRIKVSVLQLKKHMSLVTILDILRVTIGGLDSLDLEVVIEGVEDQDLLTTLPAGWRQQSFYYSNPENLIPIEY